MNEDLLCLQNFGIEYVSAILASNQIITNKNILKNSIYLISFQMDSVFNFYKNRNLMYLKIKLIRRPCGR